jgi:transcriptional regulator with XRE-family HTH domain
MRSDRASPWSSAVSVIVHAGRLRFEMIRRGWSASDLARESRLSPATISAALAGRPIAAKSLDLIGDAFTRVSARKAIDELIMGDSFDLA